MKFDLVFWQTKTPLSSYFHSHLACSKDRAQIGPRTHKKKFALNKTARPLSDLTTGAAGVATVRLGGKKGQPTCRASSWNGFWQIWGSAPYFDWRFTFPPYKFLFCSTWKFTHSYVDGTVSSPVRVRLMTRLEIWHAPKPNGLYCTFSIFCKSNGGERGPTESKRKGFDAPPPYSPYNLRPPSFPSHSFWPNPFKPPSLSLSTSTCPLHIHPAIHLICHHHSGARPAEPSLNPHAKHC